MLWAQQFHRCTQSLVFAGLGGIVGAQYGSASYTPGNDRESRL